MLSLDKATAVVVDFDVLPVSTLTVEQKATLEYAKQVVSDAAYRAMKEFIQNEASKKFIEAAAKEADDISHSERMFSRVVTIKEFYD